MKEIDNPMEKTGFQDNVQGYSSENNHIQGCLTLLVSEIEIKTIM